MTYAIRVHEYGGVEKLQWERVDPPELRAGEVLLRHTAIGLNYVEVMQRRGDLPVPLPFIPGNEGAGVIVSIGPDVKGFAVGDRVAYAPVTGSYAQQRAIRADRLVKLPSDIDDQTAAAIMLQGMTAQFLVRQIYRVGPADTVLVHAAAGGVGMILCQWAAALGATVIGTVSTDAKAAAALASGCSHVIVYPGQEIVSEVRRVTHGRMADVGRDTFAASLDSLRARGHLVSFGQASGPVPQLDIATLGRKGSLTLTRGTLSTFTGTREGLLACAHELFDVVRSGAVKVRVNQVFSLPDAAIAHHALESRQTTGSSILLP
jgi:NADPH2:quinone reductase